MQSPRDRPKNLLTTRLDDEVVVYNPETKQAHSLNRLAVSVWNNSYGPATVDELQRRVSDEMGSPIEQAAIVKALHKLEKAHLLLSKVARSEPRSEEHTPELQSHVKVVCGLVPEINKSAFVPVAA